jgi:hypothetical protein
MCLAAYEDSGETSHLDAAERALRIDLSSGVMLPDGTFHIRSGSRRLAYLDGGSTGIAMVLSRFLRYRADEEFTTILNAIHFACEIPFVLQPGLFQGRAGLLATLAQSVHDAGGDRTLLLKQASRMGWYAIADGAEIHFPGSGLTRLSTDLATGSAGILLALSSVYDQQPLMLPHLVRSP